MKKGDPSPSRPRKTKMVKECLHVPVSRCGFINDLTNA